MVQSFRLRFVRAAALTDAALSAGAILPGDGTGRETDGAERLSLSQQAPARALHAAVSPRFAARWNASGSRFADSADCGRMAPLRQALAAGEAALRPGPHHAAA